MSRPTWGMASGVPQKTRSLGSSGCPVGTGGPASNWVWAIARAAHPLAGLTTNLELLADGDGVRDPRGAGAGARGDPTGG